MSISSFNTKAPLGIVQKPTLPLEELENRKSIIHALAREASFFKGKSISSIDNISWRTFSYGALVSCKNERPVFIKIHNLAVRPISRLTVEHNFITHLQNNGIAVPSVLSCEEITYEDQKYSIEILLNIKGNDKYVHAPSWTAYLSINDTLSSGQLLGRFHKASEGFNEEDTFQLLTSSLPKAREWPEFYEQLKAFCQSTPYLKPSYDKLVSDKTTLEEVITPHLKKLANTAIEENLWIHGDWHPSNLSWIDNHPVEVFDFAMSSQQSKAFGLAVAIERSFISWLSPDEIKVLHTALLEAFMNGYKSKSSFKPSDAESVCALLPLIHIQFALSEYAFFLNTGQEDKAQIAWDSYLIGHCEYFSALEGRSALQQIHQILLAPRSK